MIFLFFLVVAFPPHLACSSSEEYYFSSISLPLKQIHICIVEPKYQHRQYYTFKQIPYFVLLFWYYVGIYRDVITSYRANLNYDNKIAFYSQGFGNKGHCMKAHVDKILFILPIKSLIITSFDMKHSASSEGNSFFNAS